MSEGSRPSGERLGAYVLDKLIARGGAGEVYLAHAEATGEPVAIKVLAEFSPAAAVRFDRESRILKRITHPHIVGRRDSGRTADGLPFLVMDLLNGDALDTVIACEVPTPVTFVDLMLQVCDALAVAHSQGVVHRDIKPSNIFVCRGEHADARLLDFGIARLAGERRLTVTGSAIGTWAYMSPEQAVGERDIDARTDVWSVGVTLYQGLGGRLPFRADSAPKMLRQIILEPAVPLDQCRPTIPTAVSAVVMRAIEKKREDRFATIQAFASALREVRPLLVETANAPSTDVSAPAIGERGDTMVAVTTDVDVGAIHSAIDMESSADGTAHVLGAVETHGRATREPAGAFVGRGIELAVLARVVDDARRTERPRGAVVLGGQGMGKSRLKDEAVRALLRTHPSATVIPMRGESSRREAPFAALKDALAEGIDPSAAALFDLRSADAETPLDSARASLETLLGGRADSGPVLFTVDDAQWIDRPSQDTLRWIVENASGLSLAVWIFARVEARDLLIDIVPAAQLLELGPFGQHESGSLLGGIVEH